MSAARKKSSSGWLKWVWLALITLAVLWVAEQVFLKPVVEFTAGKVIGARVSMGGFSLNLPAHRVSITDLKIYNEDGFPPQVFFDAPQIMVDLDPVAAIRGKIHCPLIIFRLDKMIVFKNAQGKLNVDELPIVQQNMHQKNKGPMPNFLIDELRLNIAQVLVEDDGKTPPLVEAYDLALKDKTFRHLDSVNKVVGLIMYQALKPTAIQSAGLYAATTLLGVGFLPGLAIGLAVANDEEVAELPHAAGEVYDQLLQLIQRLQGQVKKHDARAGQITATVYGCDILVRIQDLGWGKCKITIKARKYFLPKPEIAAGLVYQLKQNL